MKVRLKRILLSSGLIFFLALIGLPFLPALVFQARHVVGSSPALQQVAVVRQLALPLPTASSEIVPTPGPTEDSLVISSIGVQSLIREGKDIGVLDRFEGVWHQTGEITGNYVLAGHRFKYFPPNTQTLYNLDKVQVGDEIELWLDGVKKRYTVHQLRTVNNDDVSILSPTSTAQLLIYTCVDLTYAKRLVVIALPI